MQKRDAASRRVSIHVKRKGVSHGYLADLAFIPSKGDELLLIDGEGVTEQRIVVRVRHVLEKNDATSTVGQQLVEIEAV